MYLILSTVSKPTMARRLRIYDRTKTIITFRYKKHIQGYNRVFYRRIPQNLSKTCTEFYDIQFIFARLSYRTVGCNWLIFFFKFSNLFLATIMVVDRSIYMLYRYMEYFALTKFVKRGKKCF